MVVIIDCPASVPHLPVNIAAAGASAAIASASRAQSKKQGNRMKKSSLVVFTFFLSLKRYQNVVETSHH